jgi:signal transduction histidine kinase
VCVTITSVELIAKERDRLLQRSARLIGLSATVVALVSFAVPGVLGFTSLLSTLPLFAVLVLCLVRVGMSQSLVWVVIGLVAGFGILVVVGLPAGPASPAVSSAIVPLAAAALASFAIVLTTNLARMVILVVAFVTSAALTEVVVGAPTVLSIEGASVMLGWVLASVFGYWLSASVPRAARRIYSIGRAHRAERQASETEAQRRQGARLLHDTVLATLTLLAHSGVGVAPSALQQQAGDDARLLRQLRLGATPVPQSSGEYKLEPPSEETALGTTLESVKQRFGRMGLEVSWHGTGQVLLPSHVLDAFLLALAECLENVRRHSGVTDAHVTITDDDTTVRAMVTDAGVGFEIKDIDEARLGFKDSVVGRLQEVGGKARLFSSPGAGTTVVLEVPK